MTQTVDLLVTTDQLRQTFPWLAGGWRFTNGRQSVLITVERDDPTPEPAESEVAA